MSRKYNSYTYEQYQRSMRMIKKLGVAETSRRTGIPKPTLYHWKNGKHIPPLARWIPKPSNELAYIIGTLHGDGNLYIDKMKHGYQYRIRLGVEDYEFTETFSKNMTRLLNKKVVKPKWYKSDNRWIAVYTSKAFYIWYKQQNLELLKPYIEYSKETVANFLRALYDSEGNHYVYKRKYNQIHLSNNNLRLLKYTQYLLKKYFGIIARGPYINTKAGTESKMKNGETIKAKHDNYQTGISRKQHVRRFLSEIGFSITEKQLGLPRRK